MRGVLVLVLAALPFQAAQPAALIITAVDAETREPVPLTAVELYIDPWGGGETYQLKPHGSEVRVPVDDGWLCATHNSWCAYNGPLDARITLRAGGYEAISSDHFSWPRPGPKPPAPAGANPNSPGGAPAKIRFPGPLLRTMWPGVVQRLTVPFRRPRPRVLRIVDPAGTPIAGTPVSIRELLARTNHCGATEGTELSTASTGPGGEVPLPSGQLEFSIGIHKPHHVVHPRYRIYPTELDGRFDEPETVITLKPLTRRPLRLAFRNADGSPAQVEVKGIPRWSCSGPPWPVGKSGADGRLSVDEFYPDEFSELFVGEGRWVLDPRKESWAGRRVVTLK
jgi:hypothetical protein